MRKSLSLLLAFSVFCFAPAQSQQPNSAALEFQEGKALFGKGDYKGAILRYNKAVELNPRWAEAYLQRGYAERMSNRLDQALNDYDKATEIDPRSTKNNHAVADAYTNRGQIRQANLQPEEAIADLEKAIRLYPALSRPYETKGLARLLLEDFNGAIADFDSYLAMEKFDSLGRALVCADRSFAKLMLKKEPEAHKDFEESLKLAGKSSSAIEGRLQDLQAQLIIMRQLRAQKNKVIG